MKTPRKTLSRLAAFAKSKMADLLDDTLYAFVDGIAVIAATIDFLTDLVCSKGHPKGSWLEFVREGRRLMGWTVFVLQQRKMLLKANPNCKFFFFLGGQDVLGNAHEMGPELRQAFRIKDEFLKELKKLDDKGDNPKP